MNQSKINVFILEIDPVSSRFSRSSSEAFDDEMSTEARQEEGSAQRSVRKDHDTIDVRRQVPLRHTVHLQVIDVYCRGRWKSLDAAHRASTRAPCADIWTSSMFPDHLIYYRRCLLRFGSLYRAAYTHHQACSGYYDCDVYPLAID
jgi:hypothetical protein